VHYERGEGRGLDYLEELRKMHKGMTANAWRTKSVNGLFKKLCEYKRPPPPEKVDHVLRGDGSSCPAACQKAGKILQDINEDFSADEVKGAKRIYDMMKDDCSIGDPTGNLSPEELKSLKRMSAIIEKMINMDGHCVSNRAKLLETVEEFGIRQCSECGERGRSGWAVGKGAQAVAGENEWEGEFEGGASPVLGGEQQ
jgi:hypothetical protein